MSTMHHCRCGEEIHGEMKECRPCAAGEPDDLLPVSVYETPDGSYLLLDRHKDELARFDPDLEVEDARRIATLINRRQNP